MTATTHPLRTGGPYREVLGLPGVRALSAVAFVARIPATAAPIVLTLHVVLGLGLGYGAAGLLGAAMTVGMGVGAPLLGRLVDARGLRTMLWVATAASIGFWGTAPYLGYRWLLVGAFVGGVLGLPVFSLVKQSLAALVPDEQRRPAFAVDAMSVELSYILGPATGTLVAVAVSTSAAMWLVGGGLTLACLALYLVDPPTRPPTALYRAAPGVGRTALSSGADPGAGAGLGTEPAGRTALSSRPVGGTAFSSSTELAAEPRAGTGPGAGGIRDRAGEAPARKASEHATRRWFDRRLVAALLASGAAVGVLFGCELAVIASLQTSGQAAWIAVVNAVWCLASLAGGYAYGMARRGLPLPLLVAGLGLATLPVALGGVWWTFALLLIPAGMACAPSLTASADVVTRLAPDHARGLVTGLQASAMTLGTAVATPLSGAVIDAASPAAAILVVGGACVLVAGVAALLDPGSLRHT